MANKTAGTPRVYCTYFDSGYLSRGLALISSLRNHGDHSPVYVLALDEAAAFYLEEYASDNVHVLRIEQLERAEPALLLLKESRSRMEYYFTCTPLLIRYVMNLQKIPGGMSIYLDGDLFFFNDPELVIDDLGHSSVGIIEHRYTESQQKKLSKYGRFNVGWVGFRDDLNGRTLLDWYSEKTLEWCSDKPENGKYADQGYLDWFPEFQGVKILNSAGFNLAPWNVKRHEIEVNFDNVEKPEISVDEEPLVFFHFHGLRKIADRYVTGELSYGARLTRSLKNYVYMPYVRELADIESRLLRNESINQIPKKRGSGVWGVFSRFRKQVINLISVAAGNSIKVRN